MTHVELDEAMVRGTDARVGVLELDDVLNRLAALDPRAAQVVEMRIFGGLTVEEIGTSLGVSPRTVAGDWAMARSWLARALGPISKR